MTRWGVLRSALLTTTIAGRASAWRLWRRITIRSPMSGWPARSRENWLSWRGRLRGLGLQSARSDHGRKCRRSDAGLVLFEPASPRAIRRSPLVNDGMMFVTTPQNQIIALDAVTRGREVALRS